MILFPHAKINLGLDILRKRPDGYHDIATVMIPTNWEDILELTLAKTDTTLTVTGRSVDCPPEKNLVMKAFNAMNALTEGIPPTDIRLHKVIPDGAGLGGGSADAAFTLIGLNKLYNIGLPESELIKLAAGIGADCPFFIADRAMLCTGTGTTMSAIDLPQLSGLTLAIIKPDVHVGTAEAYSHVTPRVPPTPLPDRISAPIETWRQNVANDFEESVFPLHPQIAELKERMYTLGAVYSAMSGSGSAVFGIFPPTDPAILSASLLHIYPRYDIHCSII